MVNLKQAANQLAVHYQTAYRWVRDGELVAIKIGNRYEISESAIEQFINQRNDLLLAPIDPTTASSRSDTSRSDTLTPAAVDDDVLAEVRVLARVSRLTAQPCFDAATVVIGTRVGDAGVMRLLDNSGTQLRPVSSYAAAPELRAQVASALTAAGGFDRSAPMWAAAEGTGRVNVVHHMPRDVMRELFGAEGRFVGHGIQVLAAAVAPMFVEGLYVGGLLAVKTRSHSPFSESQIALLEETALLCSRALQSSTAFRRTWQSNSDLAARTVAWVEVDDLPDHHAKKRDINESPTNQQQLLDADRAQALLSPQGSIIASTKKFEAMTRTMSFHAEGFAGYWRKERTNDVIDGIASQVETEAMERGEPAAIVSGIRRSDAQLQLLAVDIIRS